jgi:hypothetical protein
MATANSAGVKIGLTIRSEKEFKDLGCEKHLRKVKGIRLNHTEKAPFQATLLGLERIAPIAQGIEHRPPEAGA